MKRLLITALAIFAFLTVSFGQNDTTTVKEDIYAEEDLYEDDPYFWSYSKEIGLNITSLASKFIPFNLGETDAGFMDFTWKKYYGKRAFRFGLGANLNLDEDDGKFFISLGSEKRYPISKSRKFTYSSGWDIALFTIDAGEEAFFGLSKSYGIQYHFSKRIFLSTEAALRIGVGDDIFDITFDPPAAIFLNVRLY